MTSVAYAVYISEGFGRCLLVRANANRVGADFAKVARTGDFWLDPKKAERMFRYLRACDAKEFNGIQNARHHLGEHINDGCRILRDIFMYKNGYSKTFEDLLKSPYWYRVWVIQEFDLTRNDIFACEPHRISHRISHRTFRVALSYLYRLFWEYCEFLRSSVHVQEQEFDLDLGPPLDFCFKF